MTNQNIDPYYRKKWSDYAPMRRFRFRLEALGSRIAFGLLLALGEKKSHSFLQALMGYVGPRLPLSKVMKRNIHKALKTDDTQTNHIIRGSWQNFGRVLGSYPFIQQFDSLDETQLILKGWDEHFIPAKAKNQPIIMFSAHIGNWEFISKIAEDRGEKLHRIFKPPSNPLVYDFFRTIRVDDNHRDYLHPADQRSLIKVIKALKKGGSLAILVDQKYTNGIDVPFFDRLAPTNHLIATLAMKTGAIILPCHSYWDEKGRLTAEVEAPLTYIKDKEDEQTQYNILSKINQSVERWVRHHPDQWFWQHRRWSRND